MHKKVEADTEMSVAYSEPRQKSMMKLSAKKLTAKSFIIDIWQSSKYASGLWMPEKKNIFLKF